MFNVSLSASIKTGINPFFKIGVIVVAKVKAAVITSDPKGKFATSAASINDDVPEFVMSPNFLLNILETMLTSNIFPI